ncbi:MAG TPA: methyltransferase domain-containing protein [Thermodesulfobacteriota bacterium]|nr:methyltransferase domain-containing protein [Thermodesulfobacteriota bacterium]
MELEAELREDETLDGPYGLKVIQKKGYYRYSQDSLLLADFAGIRKNDEIIDLGTGCGIITLILAKRGLGNRIVGVEIQKELVEVSRRNIRLNGFEEKIEIVEGDIRSIGSLFPPNCFDYVITNPPYIETRTGFIKAGSHRTVARHEVLCNMGDVLEVMRYLLKSLRCGACIYPAARFAELVTEAKRRRLEPGRIQFVYPGPREKAELVMVEFIKEGNPRLEVLPPLVG